MHRFSNLNVRNMIFIKIALTRYTLHSLVKQRFFRPSLKKKHLLSVCKMFCKIFVFFSSFSTKSIISTSISIGTLFKEKKIDSFFTRRLSNVFEFIIEKKFNSQEITEWWYIWKRYLRRYIQLVLPRHVWKV